jgi:TonB family protein
MLAMSLCAVFWCRAESSDDAKKNAKTEANSANDDSVYEPGGDVKPPKLLHYVEPAFSASSKEAFVEGTVKISAVITTDGKPTEARVVKGLNADEDRTATEAVLQWRFAPGTKDGRRVKVRVNVEVDFHLL